MEKKIIHDVARSRFEVEIDGHTAYVRYLAFEGGLDVLTTQVPPELEGQGVASALTRHVLEYVRERRLRVIPTCSFTSAYLRRHPEYKELAV